MRKLAALLVILLLASTVALAAPGLYKRHGGGAGKPPTSIDAIAMTNTTFPGGASSGTLVGTLSITMSAFGSTYAGTTPTLSGTGAGSFRVVLVSGVYQVQTFCTGGGCTVPAGNYPLNVIATQTGAGGSPFTQSFVINGTADVPNMASLSLSSQTFLAGQPTETFVADITVGMTTGTFTGAITIGGPNASSFEITGVAPTYQLKTVGVLAANTYQIDLMPFQAGATCTIPNGCISAQTLTATPSGMLLSRSTDNPNYFKTSNGNPVYLTGSHTWQSLQGTGNSFPPPGLDYPAYLAWMQANSFNFMRMWMFADEPRDFPYNSGMYIDPLPYARTSGGTCCGDGGQRFTIPTTAGGAFNQTYFDLLRSRVQAAKNAGIYVAVMLWDGWSLNDKGSGTNPWPNHPYKLSNNGNGTTGINGDPTNSGVGDRTHTTDANQSATLTAQQAYVGKVIETVHDLDNVLYEISNEDESTAKQWQYNMITYIKNYESSHSYPAHPVGMTFLSGGGAEADVLNSPADWVSFAENQTAWQTNPPVNSGAKVSLLDTDHIFGAGGDSTWAWKSFTRGHQPIFMDDLGSTGINLGGGSASFPAAYYTTRTGMTQTASYAARLDLKTAVPHGELTTAGGSPGYMLANPGTQYLAFAPTGGTFTVDLSAAGAVNHNFSVEWYNVTLGVTQSATAIVGGSSTASFASPFQAGTPSVLFLNNTGVTTVATASLSANPTSISIGASSTLTWSSTNVTSCTSPNFTTGNQTSGSVSVSPIVTTTFTLNCTGPNGPASATASVTVGTGQVGNCATGAFADGCVIFAGETKTVKDGGSSSGNAWGFDNASNFVNGSVTFLTLNGVAGGWSDGRFLDGGCCGDAVMIANGGQVYVRGLQKLTYRVTPTSHTATLGAAWPTHVTAATTPWMYANAGGAAQAMGIAAPISCLNTGCTSNYAQSSLVIAVDGLPTNATVTSGGTPVTVGQTLTTAQLQALQMTPTATGLVKHQDSSFSYTVKDPTGAGTFGSVGITIYPSGLWHDPPITVLSGAGIDTAPALPQPAATGDLVAVRVQNASAGNFAAGSSVQFAHVFLPGTVQPATTLCARPTGSGTCSVYVQKDDFALNGDGSVRHAGIAFNINSPQLAAGATRDFMISKCGGGGGQPTCPAAPTAAANNTTLAAGAEFASGNADGNAYSCKGILNASNGGTGGAANVQPRSTITNRNGPVVKSYSAMGIVGTIKVNCDIAAFSDGHIETDVVPDNTWGTTVGGKSDRSFTFTSSPAPSGDGFSATVKLFLYSLYVHRVTKGTHAEPYVQFDVPYWSATGAIPPVDVSLGVNDSFLTSSSASCGGSNLDGGTLWAQAAGCYTLNAGNTGNLTARIAAEGSREEIAPEPNYATQWWSSQNPAAWRRQLGNARLMGNIPWNFYDERTGQPICGDASCGANQITNFLNGAALANGDPSCQNAPCANGNAFTGVLDGNSSAHAPSLAYVPYLVTGNRYFQRLMEFNAAWQVLQSVHAYATAGAGDVQGNDPAGALAQFSYVLSNLPWSDQSQGRGVAWQTRTLGEVAYIAPTSSGLKTQWVNQVSRGMDLWVRNKVVMDMASAYGKLRQFADEFAPNPQEGIQWHGDFFLAGLGNISGYQIPTASPAARRLTQYLSNYHAGSVIMGQQGMPAFDSTPFAYNSTCSNWSGVPCTSGGIPVTQHPPSNWPALEPMNDWTLMLSNNVMGSPDQAGAVPGFTMNLGWIGGGNCQGDMGSYCRIRLTGLANIVRARPSTDSWAAALLAWGYMTLTDPQATQAAGSGGVNFSIDSYRNNNQFVYPASLPDGNVLYQSQQNLVLGGGTQTCATSPCELATVAETGQPYTQSSTNSGSYDLMLAWAVGGSQIGSSRTPGQGGGGGGTGTQTCSPNGAICVTADGCGASTVKTGSGNAFINPRAFCYGASGAHTIELGFTLSGKTVQVGIASEYSGYSSSFRPGTDPLRIKSNLNGRSYTTSASFTNFCSVSNGDTICDLGLGSTLKLKGVTSAITATIF